jgi:hypothetical protein
MSMLLQVHARQALYGCVVGQAVHDRALHRSACNCCSELHRKGGPPAMRASALQQSCAVIPTMPCRLTAQHRTL